MKPTSHKLTRSCPHHLHVTCMVAASMIAAAAVLTPTSLAADRLTPIKLGSVKVGGEIGRRIDVTVRNNVLGLKVDDDFLEPFREKKRQGGYVGLGKLIDSVVRFAAYTGDEQVVALKDRVVAETIKTQEEDGYIGMFVPAKRMWTLWDVHEMAYLAHGLASDYRFFKNTPSLDAARKTADYIIKHWSAKPEAKPGGGDITVHMAVTGIELALFALHELTGDARYLDFCVNQRRLAEWDYPIVIGRWGQIGGHAYTYMDRCMAQLQLHRQRPEPRLLERTHNVVDFLTRRDGLVITGTCGDHECWHDTQTGTTNLAETCTTAYLIRLMDDLLRMEGEPRYGDIMERAIHNALFAAQSPDGRRIRYYSPFDGPRAYFEGDTYCCPCNYRRIVADLPAMVYYRAGTGLAVNLYVASTAEIELGGDLTLTVRQETDYPNSGRVVLHLNPSKSAAFPVRLRIPRWCRQAKVAVNAKPVDGAVTSGKFFTLEQSWKSGDRIELDMPMPWRLVKGRQAQAGRVAVMRGPSVFCLSRAQHKALAKIDLRLITLDAASVEGPTADDTVRPDGLACSVRAWGPGKWYPFTKTDLHLKLTEFPDPAGEATYFNVPNPKLESFVDDELIQLGKAQ